MAPHRLSRLLHGAHSAPLELVAGTVVMLNGDPPTPGLLNTVLGYQGGGHVRHSVVCADGGANRLYDLLHCDQQRRDVLPAWIRGDLDSLRQGVKEFYQSCGVQIEHVGDQSTTDFEKCLHRCQSECSAVDGDQTPIVVVGWEGGRLDHVFATIHALYRFSGQPRPIYLVGETSLVMCLSEPVEHIVLDLKTIGPVCGLFALGKPCEGIETSGLRWNLDGERTLEMGKFTSSSNEAVSSVVEVRTPPGSQVVWTCQLAMDAQPGRK